MTDTDPLTERIALALAECAAGADPHPDTISDETPHWTDEARAVIAALHLTTTTTNYRDMDGRLTHSHHEVDGAWNEPGDDW